MWGNMGFQQQPVAVRRRITPPPAAAKLHMIVSDYADSQLIALVMDTAHRIMAVPVKQYTIREPGVRAVPILMMDFDPIIDGEAQFTPSTFAALSPQELLFPWREARIPPQSQSLVHFHRSLCAMGPPMVCFDDEITSRGPHLDR